MKKYTDMSLQERQAEYAAVQVEYEKLKAMGLSLNMARGKPSKAQLDLVTPIFGLLTKPEDFVSDGIDVRNYGTLDGGFYTAAGVLPPCRYFCVTNMPLDDQWAEQNALLAEGSVDYVVALTGDLGTAFPRYAVVDQCSCDGGEGLLTWYLYKRQA